MAALTANDIMTRDVATIPEEATLHEAATILESRGISGAPVVNAAGDLVGMLTEADLIDEAKRQGSVPRVSVFGFFLVPEDQLQRLYDQGFVLQVKSVMSRRLHVAQGATPVAEIADTMVRHKINRVPIVDEAGKLVGIVARADVLRSMRETA